MTGDEHQGAEQQGRRRADQLERDGRRDDDDRAGQPGDEPELRRIPVVVLTTSEEERDIVSSYELGANAYISKPIRAPQVIKQVKELLGL